MNKALVIVEVALVLGEFGIPAQGHRQGVEVRVQLLDDE